MSYRRQHPPPPLIQVLSSSTRWSSVLRLSKVSTENYYSGTKNPLRNKSNNRSGNLNCVTHKTTTLTRQPQTGSAQSARGKSETISGLNSLCAVHKHLYHTSEFDDNTQTLASNGNLLTNTTEVVVAVSPCTSCNTQ